jgi:hypothetical protein
MSGTLLRIAALAALAIAAVAWFLPGSVWTGGAVIVLVALALALRAWRASARRT